MIEVQVNADFAELQNRTNKLRHHAEAILHTTKVKLEQAAKESGLPVTFILTAGIKFPEVEKEAKQPKSKTPK